MNRGILVASVFHTGTRFFLGLLSDAMQEEYFHILPRHKVPDFRPLALCHIEKKRMKHIQYYMEHYNPVLVIPIRDYDATKASWQRRRTHYQSDLDVCVALRSWLIDEYDPVIVSIDDPERDKWLEELSQATGLRLETDWKPAPKHVV